MEVSTDILSLFSCDLGIFVLYSSTVGKSYFVQPLAGTVSFTVMIFFNRFL